MFIDYLLGVFRANKGKEAIIWHGQSFPYEWLLGEVDRWRHAIAANGVQPGTVVSIETDFSPRAISLMLSLIEHGCVVVPLTSAVEANKPEFRHIAEVEAVIQVREDEVAEFQTTDVSPHNPLILQLKQSRHPGLVLFSSGSTGKSKAALHDLVPMLEKFKVARTGYRALTFLLFDHIGGINTLFYNLSNAGCLVTVTDRDPETICRAIEQHRVQLLPTSPTFLNLLLVSEVYRQYDLSSLELVTYGTEVMSESTLKRFHTLFPSVRLLQTYGLSEVGILRSKSRSSDSLWVKVGGEGFKTRVVDGMLEIKAQSAMLGYLNAPSPFTEDGWFKTGDAVEVDEEFLKILGRKSEIINVGGEKVYPAEVESVLQMMEGVEEVAVNGESNPITGQIVIAKVKLLSDESLAAFRKRMRAFCNGKLSRYKIPQKVFLVENSLHGARFKKMRREIG